MSSTDNDLQDLNDSSYSVTPSPMTTSHTEPMLGSSGNTASGIDNTMFSGNEGNSFFTSATSSSYSSDTLKLAARAVSWNKDI